MSQSKEIFQFKKPFWKRAWNRVDRVTRLSLFITITTLVMLSSTIKEGLRNQKIMDSRDEWIKKEVRDPKATHFMSLDREDPPTVVLKPPLS